MTTADSKRTYRMSKRAESAAQTERAIFEAASRLWNEKPFTDITLEAIAAEAGVSVRTVIRRYGSKEGLYEKGIQSQAADMPAEREKARVGDVLSAVTCLLEDYESFGDGLIRMLAAEEHLAAAQKVLSAGRDYHRSWCARIFEPYLPGPDEDQYNEMLSAYVAASDLYLWKLLRRDLAHDLDTTTAIFVRLLKGLVDS